MSNKKTQEEGVVDAMANEETKHEVVASGNTQVSTQVDVAGVSLRFPFVRVAQALSQWRCNGKPPALGEFYIGKDKTNNVHIAGYGRDEGFNAILLDVVPGIMEDKPFTGNANPPRRWTGPNFIEAAAAEGFSLTPVATGEVWQDSGRPKMRANASMFCYLQLLVPVSEDFDTTDYQVFPIGDHLYTPARIEYSKGAFKSLNEVIGNIKRMEEFRNRKKPEFKFTWNGKVVRIFSEEAVSKQTGATYPFLRFGLAMDGGKPVELNDEERADFTSFLTSVSSGSAVMSDIDSTPEF